MIFDGFWQCGDTNWAYGVAFGPVWGSRVGSTQSMGLVPTIVVALTNFMVQSFSTLHYHKIYVVSDSKVEHYCYLLSVT